MPKSALIIEDDADIAESVRYNLASEGFAPLIAATGEQGLALALDSKNPPELIVLDLMLPGMSGMELCRRLRRETQTRKTPIIMLTAKTSESDRIAGLDLGADDYITKPFSVRELLARVRAVLRRAKQPVDVQEVIRRGELVIDIARHEVTWRGQKMALTATEFKILEFLAGNQVWGYSYYGDARTLDVHIRRLRQKLGACGNCIETVVGVGYRFIGCGSHTSASSATGG